MTQAGLAEAGAEAEAGNDMPAIVRQGRVSDKLSQCSTSAATACTASSHSTILNMRPGTRRRSTAIAPGSSSTASGESSSRVRLAQAA
ncbi:hypothetical protein G6F51_014425 [Rhizopus arrhizus]|uniref:Uncharacterized protein n=1 Tax=Rhizopus oryzae TaxID=64495 RepID=A0A9P6XMJ2_RHIOR|nr:hypothetical protein G6F51_014425 [Rhizopus arrhizus]